MNKMNVTVPGHKGSFYVIDEGYINGELYYLLEHNTYGEDAPAVAIGVDNGMIFEDIFNGLEEVLERLEG